MQGTIVGRRELAKYEELDEEEENQGNGELAEQEALREGKAADSQCVVGQIVE